MIVSPSLLSCDFGHLADSVDIVNRSNAQTIHFDVMDGVFVQNLSFGFPILKSVAELTTKPIDAHLMIIDPDRYVSRFAQMGVKSLSVHYEACPHLIRTIQNIRNCGMSPGVALNPHTPESLMEYAIEYCDFVLVMSVNPGMGGQTFIESSLRKIASLKEMIVKKNLNTLIEVDGGVNYDNAKILADAGADVLVIGNTIFTADDPFQMINDILAL